jgi:hypothetical protein
MIGNTSFPYGPNRTSCVGSLRDTLPCCRSKWLPWKLISRFVEYLLELSNGVTGRIIEVLRRAAFQAIADKSQKVGLQQLQYVGARMPSVIGRRS